MKDQKKKAGGLLNNHRHWQKTGVNVNVPRTVGAVLRGHKQTVASSQDCEPCPCTCTGCSEWD